MSSMRFRVPLLVALAAVAGCASAEDRLEEGVALQTQGRYMQAVYRYIDSIEKDPSLVEAQERLLAAGDSAVMQAMNDADDLERRGDPVRAARLYGDVDDMVAAARRVGMRIPLPYDYADIRRAIFDTAIRWQMDRGDEAAAEGRWQAARSLYVGARSDHEPSRVQMQASLDAEEAMLFRWAETELVDGHPRAAHALAMEAGSLQASPRRESVLRARDLQERALEGGTVVLAVAPVTADGGVREFVGGEFEMALDDVLAHDHWTRPPLFVEMADPLVLRRELRGLLRGRLVQSPTVVGRSLGLIGADLGAMVRLTGIEVVERDVDTDEHRAIVPRNSQANGRRASTPVAADTVTYATVEGDLSYRARADVLIVDPDGREVRRFEVVAEQVGPFQRGEFEGDPRTLDLPEKHEPFFDPVVFAEQVAAIESALLDELAAAIGTQTYEQVLAGIR